TVDRSQPGSVRYQADGVDYLAGLAPAPLLDWEVVTTYPTALVLAGVAGGREVAFGVLILAAGLSAIIGGLVAGRFVRPLSVLGIATESLLVEEIAAPLPESSFTEVQRLASSFSRMR